eukprot:COSAG02_NODE_687_length_18478_cov_23.093476_4_plen_180_part_00
MTAGISCQCAAPSRATEGNRREKRERRGSAKSSAQKHYFPLSNAKPTSSSLRQLSVQRLDRVRRASEGGKVARATGPASRAQAAPLASSPRYSSKGARFSGREHRSTHTLQYRRPAQGQRGSDQALELGGQASNAAAGPRCDGQPATRPHDRTARAPRASARAPRSAAPAATFRRNWPG